MEKLTALVLLAGMIFATQNRLRSLVLLPCLLGGMVLLNLIAALLLKGAAGEETIVTALSNTIIFGGLFVAFLGAKDVSLAIILACAGTAAALLLACYRADGGIVTTPRSPAFCSEYFG